MRTLTHTEDLPLLSAVPGYLAGSTETVAISRRYSCSFCGVGDSAIPVIEHAVAAPAAPNGDGTLAVETPTGIRRFSASLANGNELTIHDDGLHSTPILSGTLTINDQDYSIIAQPLPGNEPPHQFRVQQPKSIRQKTKLNQKSPTPGCLKLRTSMGLQAPTFPYHVEPSVRGDNGERVAIRYEQAIERLATLLLDHRPPHGRSLVYGCGQIDYFTIFAFQEVFRLLGIRNLAGNAEHCLNAGAVHNEILTGQEGPFLTLEQSFQGDNRLFLLNGWNGLITHPPAFGQLLKTPNFDGYMVEVAETESARTFVKKFGEDRLLLIRSGSDPQLALSVAHEILKQHPAAINSRFLTRFADSQSWQEFAELASQERFAAEATAPRIAPIPALESRLVAGIQRLAAQLAKPETVPINIPSVGLSQTKGAVAHCLWGSVLAMLGKYGLKTNGTPAGGTLRIPGQVNAQTEVQGLSRGFFMGRIRMTDEGISDVTGRMGLPADAYRMAVEDDPRAALDYGDPTEEPELFICFGTQFESNMPGRERWIKKLKSPKTTLVVIDPIPDPFTIEHADLILPSPPHSAAAKLYQNGEWRLTLSVPQRESPPETRTDATIVYDLMARISEQIREEPQVANRHPDLAEHASYLQQRFESTETGGGLPRVNGEVRRQHLWDRIQDYMTGPADGLGPIYCRPEHADGSIIRWDELLEQGEIIYGGVGTHRYLLDYDNPDHVPFRDIWRRPGNFRFFVPVEADLELVDGIVLVTGRSSLSDEMARVRFAIATFNSGKATSPVDMPDDNPLFLSRELAQQHGITDGDQVRVTNNQHQGSLVLSAVVSDRIHGETIYRSFHKTQAEIKKGVYMNDITSHEGRCPYTSQSNFKLTTVTLEKVS